MNILNLPGIFIANLKKKYQFFIFWSGRRTEINNWFICWLVSSSLSVQIMSKYKMLPGLTEKIALCLKYTNKMKLNFRFDQFSDLVGLVDTYNSYIHNLKIELNGDNTVVDIGAHVGTFSIPLYFTHPEIRIYAFEPHPGNYEQLKENIRINHIDVRNFQANQLAVSNDTGYKEFSYGNTSTTGALTEAGFHQKNVLSGGIKCRTQTLKDIFEKFNIEHCKILKVDCEGSEYAIFESVSPELLKKVENIIVEAHPTDRHMPQDLKEQLEDYGFKTWGIPHGNGCWDYFCRRH